MMETEIPWDRSRMEFKPVDMTVSHDGGMRFSAALPSGESIRMEAHRHLGGGGQTPNPIDYLIASLGGCVGIKILLALSDHGVVPDEMTIVIHATRRETMPALFDRVHLTITLRADLDDGLIAGIADQTITRFCPIAAMFAEVGEVTAECRVVRR